MSVLESWVANPLAGAVGWTLVHSLWEGALIAAALGVTLAAVRSSRTRYAAACGAMLLLVGSFAITLVRMLPESGVRTRIVAVPVTALRALGDGSMVSSSKIAWNTMVPWIAPFWVAGVLLFYAWQMAGWLGASRLRRRGVCNAAAHWQQATARFAAQMRLARPVMLLESCLTEVPVVVGHFRPVILIPVGWLAGLPAQQVEAILAHELAHIRRYDYLVNLWQRVIEGLLFYHPAAWWISHVMRAERENCCDDVVVEMTGDAHLYAATLAALEETRCYGREPALAATGGSLVKRIHRLLYPDSSTGTGAPVVAGIILMITAAATLVAWQPQPAAQASAAVTPSQQSVPPPVPQAVQVQTPPPAATHPMSQAPVRGSSADRLTQLETRVRILTLQRDIVQAKVAEMQSQSASATQLEPMTRELRVVVGDLALLQLQILAQNMPPVRQVASAAKADTPQDNSQEAARKQKEERLRKELESPYRKWLNEDVAYIITDAERAAFKNLTDDAEREQFIMQFWERRNPTPGRTDNPFKEEHYRRIAYANSKFSAKTLPGWKTDMGRIYIVYGPPDEKEVHPQGIPQPYQSWRYKFIEGVGTNVIVEFVDKDGTGEYRMTSDPLSH